MVSNFIRLVAEDPLASAFVIICSLIGLRITCDAAVQCVREWRSK